MSGKTELLLFHGDLPQIAALDAYFVNVYPENTLGVDSTEIVFNIAGSGNEYMDLNDTLLTIQMQFLQPNKTPYTTDLTFAPTNFFMNALFKDIKLEFNGVIIEGGTDYYAYKATIEEMFQFDEETKNLQLKSKGYYSVDVERKASVTQSNMKEYCGVLRLDFFNQPKYLLTGVNVKMTLKRNSNVFCISDAEPANRAVKPFINIMNAFIRVRKVKVNAGVEMGHNAGILANNVRYCYNAGKMVRYALPTGTLDYVKENIFVGGLLPKFVIVCFVTQESYTGGDATTSPFVFKHMNVKKVNLYVDGSSYPYRGGYEPNFETKCIEDVYMRSIVHCPQHMNKNVSNGISFKEFLEGEKTFFTFNLTPDFDMFQKQVPRNVNLNMELNFARAVDVPINVLIYGLFDTELEITAARAIVKTNHVF